MAQAGQRASVTGGGRGIGENIARELALAGIGVAVSGRTAEQVERVAAATGGRALVGDVTSGDDVEWNAIRLRRA
jgi:3-oxoacyl-[acyl-carrier protein] reductase